MSIIRKTDGGTTTNTWEWVASRVNPFEVTTGFSTLADSNNFKTAFDLDFPTGFTVQVLANEVIITSQTFNEDFIGVSAVDNLGNPLTITNYEATISETNITTADNVTEIGYNLTENTTGNELTAGIRVVDDINNPIHLIIQNA